MNRLNQIGEMDNATTPSDALDEALKAFDKSQYENLPNELLGKTPLDTVKQLYELSLIHI